MIIADPPYNLGKNAYASNPSWYNDGDNANGESELAGKEFFDTDKDFRPAEFMHFCSQMLVKGPKQGVTDEEEDVAPNAFFLRFARKIAKICGLNDTFLKIIL